MVKPQREPIFIWKVNQSGLWNCLENRLYGDELYGDRHLSLPPPPRTNVGGKMDVWLADLKAINMRRPVLEGNPKSNNTIALLL